MLLAELRSLVTPIKVTRVGVPKCEILYLKEILAGIQTHHFLIMNLVVSS